MPLFDEIKKRLEVIKTVKCDSCRGSIEGTKYTCIDCKPFVLCLHCMRSGTHSQHTVVESDGTAGNTTQPPATPVVKALVTIPLGMVSPPASSQGIPRRNNPRPSESEDLPCSRPHGGALPSSAPYLPYGIARPAPPMEGQITFPRMTSRNDSAHGSQRREDEETSNDQFTPLRRESDPLITNPIQSINPFIRNGSLPVSGSKVTPQKTEDTVEENLALRWSPPEPGVTFKRHLLLPSDPEFKVVLETMAQSGGSEWTEKVASVHRIENHRWYRSYRSRFEDMERDNDPGIQNERILYHGTNGDVVMNICRDGFNRSYCGRNATAFGDGVYFARSIDYSASSKYSIPDINGQKYIFQCRVLTGHSAQGLPGLKEPPLRNHEMRFDSVVDDIDSPRMYVIFRDMQAYPEYLLTLNV